MIKTILFVLALCAVVFATPYSDGYKAGFKAGYCYGKTYCSAPLPPLAPLPDLGKNSYMDGYNRGFLAGIAKSEE